jgi:hypothetical protein
MRELGAFFQAGRRHKVCHATERLTDKTIMVPAHPTRTPAPSAKRGVSSQINPCSTWVRGHRLTSRNLPNVGSRQAH